MNEHDWAKKYYQGAVGFTITAARMSADGFPVLICKRKQKGKKQETIRDNCVICVEICEISRENWVSS